MEKQVADKFIAEYLKILYGFAVSKTFSFDEAEELSAQIVLEVYKSLLEAENVVNINGYIYHVASNVYARFVSDKNRFMSVDGIEFIPDSYDMHDSLLKWTLVCFLAHKLGTAEITDWKYAVKRPDGGEYVANVTLINDYAKEKSGYHKYWACGDMWRMHCDENIWWRSWQLNCHWTDREGYWRGNLETDYDKLYHFINGNLPESSANTESYQRLLDKGYLIKENGEYKVNIILCDSKDKWHGFVPEFTEEITVLSKEYADLSAKAAILNQPKHMHEQIKYYEQNSACRASYSHYGTAS